MTFEKPTIILFTLAYIMTGFEIYKEQLIESYRQRAWSRLFFISSLALYFPLSCLFITKKYINKFTEDPHLFCNHDYVLLKTETDFKNNLKHTLMQCKKCKHCTLISKEIKTNANTSNA